ncbi:MAG: hypothetical protein K8W52_17350 [Deltaproteobacteria bacterium]|nr:hypothetical protein [Deltaproteobacteria bacterium]
MTYLVRSCFALVALVGCTTTPGRTPQDCGCTPDTPFLDAAPIDASADAAPDASTLVTVPDRVGLGPAPQPDAELTGTVATPSVR